MSTLHGMFPEDYMSEEERVDYQAMKKIDLDREKKRPKPRLVQMVQEDVHFALHDLSLADIFTAVEAHVEARPDVDTKELEQFAMRMSRLAWEKEREN